MTSNLKIQLGKQVVIKIGKVWKCICGKTVTYDGIMEAMRFFTHDKRCNKCGNLMHIKSTFF